MNLQMPNQLTQRFWCSMGICPFSSHCEAKAIAMVTYLIYGLPSSSDTELCDLPALWHDDDLHA